MKQSLIDFRFMILGGLTALIYMAVFNGGFHNESMIPTLIGILLALAFPYENKMAK